MKKKLLSVLALTLAGAGMLMACGATQVTAAAAGSGGKITVSGKGAVNVKPDIAYITIGYTNQDKDPKAAQSDNNAQMQKILDAIKSMGIADKDIQTTQFNIYPQTDYNKGNEITGYSVTNMVNVTVRKLDQAGDALDKAIAAGANAGGNIQFAIADPSPYYEQAMALAIQNAAPKAKAIAKAINVAIGSPSEVTEMNSYYTPALYGNSNMMTAADAGAAMPVQAGDLSVSADIQVVYEY